jgi:hypothetical protein
VARLLLASSLLSFVCGLDLGLSFKRLSELVNSDVLDPTSKRADGMTPQVSSLLKKKNCCFLFLSHRLCGLVVMCADDERAQISLLPAVGSMAVGDYGRFGLRVWIERHQLRPWPQRR